MEATQYRPKSIEYQVCHIGRALTLHFVLRIDLDVDPDERVFDNALCRFSHGRITYRSPIMSKEEAIAKTTCRACLRQLKRRVDQVSPSVELCGIKAAT